MTEQILHDRAWEIIRAGGDLQALLQLLKEFHATGGYAQTAADALYLLRPRLTESQDDLLLEALDVIYGFCAPNSRIWTETPPDYVLPPFDPDLWQRLRAHIPATAPAWVQKLKQLSVEQVVHLPRYVATPSPAGYQPSVDEIEITASYMQFLREQIALNARGHAWSDLLQRRINAQEPFVGQYVWRVSLYTGTGEQYSFFVDQPLHQLIYTEADE